MPANRCAELDFDRMKLYELGRYYCGDQMLNVQYGHKVGDINGDGIPDYAFYYYTVRSSSFDRSIVLGYSHKKRYYIPGVECTNFSDQYYEPHFGESSDIGDINGDGVDDIHIYMKTNSDNSNFIFFGASDIMTVMSAMQSWYNTNPFSNSFVNRGFKIDFSDLPVSFPLWHHEPLDFNGDGINDFIIRDPEVSFGGIDYRGRIYTVMGHPNIGSGGVLKIAEMNGNHLLIVNGRGSYRIGALVNVFDVNKDGYDDFGFVAPYDRFDILLGNQTVANQSSIVTANFLASPPYPTEGRDERGRSFALRYRHPITCDIDNDNIPELMMGDRYYGYPSPSSSENFYGSIYIFGNKTGDDTAPFVDFPRSYLRPSGLRVVGEIEQGGVYKAACTDINGDGFQDLRISMNPSTYDSAGQKVAAYTYFLFGHPQFKNNSYFYLSDVDGENGFKIKGNFIRFGDYNQDGYSDVPVFKNGTFYLFKGFDFIQTFNRNQLTLNQGDTVVLNGNDIDVLDCYSDPSVLQYNITGLENGRFEFSSNPGVAIDTFSQHNLTAEVVRFVHPGGNFPPRYNLAVSNGVNSTGPVAAEIDFNFSRPTFVNNKLLLNEGQSVQLDPSYIAIKDGDSDASDIQLTATSVMHGRFRRYSTTVTKFSYQDLLDRKIWFSHDGSEFPPSYQLTVDDTELSTGPESAEISFTNVNDAPIMVNKQLRVNEGQMVTLTPNDLSATDPDNPSNNLQFIFSNVMRGYFELASAPGIPVTRVDQQSVVEGALRFIHDGEEVAPQFDVHVTDGQKNSASSAASISFSNISDPPELVNRTLVATEGASTVITPVMLSATDIDNNDENIKFTFSDIEHGRFERSDNPGVPLLSCVQYAIQTQSIRFVHDGSELPPQMKVALSDGGNATASFPVNVTYHPVNNPPVFENYKMILNEGQSLIVSTYDIKAVDRDTDDRFLRFSVSNLQYGQFEYVNQTGVEIRDFSQADINHSSLRFVHDGSNAAPTFWLSVSDGEYSQGPLLAQVIFSPVNDMPQLKVNALTILQGGSVLITESSLQAIDEETPAGQLQFYVSNVQQGQFESVLNPGTTLSRFSQQLLTDRMIQFVHNNKEVPPAYDVSVGDGSLVTVPAQAQINYINVNDKPVLMRNRLEITEGESIVLTAEQLSAQDDETAASDLNFTTSEVQHGRFYRASDAATVYQFSQSDVTGGQIGFEHDGGEIAPHYRVRVSDGALSTEDQPVSVSFMPVNDMPQLKVNALTILQGGSVLITESSLQAIDEETPAGQLQFYVSNVQQGQFESVLNPGTTLSRFSQQLLTDRMIQFVHNNKEVPPAYDVSVGDGSLVTVPAQAQINYINVNDKPVLMRNRLEITEGESIVLTAEQLSAQDDETAASDLNFTTSEVQHGRFYRASDAATVYQFSQSDVTGGQIGFEHDGGEIAPHYRVRVSDGALSTEDQPVSVSFMPVNDAPVLDNNQMAINQDQRLTVTTNDLSASDPDSAETSLLFTVSDVSGGYFTRRGASQLETRVFQQHDVMAGLIEFQHLSGVPSYAVSVSDGFVTTDPETALVNFNENAGLSQGQGVNAEMIYDVLITLASCLVTVIGFFLLRDRARYNRQGYHFANFLRKELNLEYHDFSDHYGDLYKSKISMFIDELNSTYGHFYRNMSMSEQRNLAAFVAQKLRLIDGMVIPSDCGNGSYSTFFLLSVGWPSQLNLSQFDTLIPHLARQVVDEWDAHKNYQNENKVQRTLTNKFLWSWCCCCLSSQKRQLAAANQEVPTNPCGFFSCPPCGTGGTSGVAVSLEMQSCELPSALLEGGVDSKDAATVVFESQSSDSEADDNTAYEDKIPMSEVVRLASDLL